ncbi:MAG: HAMP domain-containing sensor histidine kinase [Comamonadaceae bacterium]
MKVDSGPMHRPWRSVGFRLAFYYGLLVIITMIVTISIIYMQTVGVLYQGMTRQVLTVSQKLTTRFESGGPNALVQDIQRELGDEQNSATEIFLYVDSRGAKLAGNLDQPPMKVDGLRGGDHRLMMRRGQEISGYVIAHSLADGSQLFVGNDLHDQEAMDSLVTRGIALACAVAFVLLLGGLFVFRQELDRSVEPIRRTLTRVAGGEIKERVEPMGQEDEFALLGNDINKMLDRIEVLMNGVRHVSDTIAHNLRTPLTRILLRLRTAAEDTSISAMQKKHLEDAIVDIEELISVFEKLLQIAEAEAGARRIDFQPVSLSSVVSEVVDFYEAVAEVQKATLGYELSGKPVVMGDPDLLASAVANLVDNALKYGGIGTAVMIRTAVTRDHVLLAVEDNGPGIPAQELRMLGTRFFRLDRGTAGHGLGLASVVAIASLHGGRISFDPATPGLKVLLEFPRHLP